MKKRATTPRHGYSDLLQNCRLGRSWHAEHVCCLNLASISYSFWNKWQKVLTFWKFDEKRAITPNWVLRLTSKLQGMIDHVMLHIFAI